MWFYIILVFIVLALICAWLAITAPEVDENQQPVGGILNPVDFPERTDLIAEHQEEYKTLPALIKSNQEGEVVTCWQLTLRQRLRLLTTGRLWASQWTFRQPMQPLMFSVDKADLIPPVGGLADLAQ